MKNVALMGLVLALVAGNANASDYTYTETETVVVVENLSVNASANNCGQRFVSSRDVRPNVKPCAARAGEPVRVKTHTEVVDHYQVYQPVTVYQPMGTYTHRYVVPAKKCGHCGA
ncbi:MAG: hypothetical protein J6K82_01745 [Alphaproteobacteria bacterium]|nr:hypothetical protein [Alphaproteobacteria bacterium]